MPGTQKPMVGVPWAAASMTERPQPSSIEGWMRAQASLSSSCLRVSLTRPDELHALAGHGLEQPHLRARRRPR